jgi:hypothetical protein
VNRYAKRSVLMSLAAAVAGLLGHHVCFGQEPVPTPSRGSEQPITVVSEPQEFPPSPFTIAEAEPLDLEASLTSPASNEVKVGYDGGFVIASRRELDLQVEDSPFLLRINGYGQLRDTVFRPDNSGEELNQLQLKRARLIFSGHAFNPDFTYFVQLDGRSNSGDVLRLLDYFFNYDFGHHDLGWQAGAIGFKGGLYKVPSSMARQVSGREFQFTDRSVASTFFDVNRSLAWGLYGRIDPLPTPLHWEAALFNGLVTGGAETGSRGGLDNNTSFAGRVSCFPLGDWGPDDLADLSYHESPATRVGASAVFSTIDSSGPMEFASLRVVDSGQTLASLLPAAVDQYGVAIYSIDASMKYRGVSLTSEFYLRNLGDFRGATIPTMFDHGYWLQSGFFVIPKKIELLSRWSRVIGDSGTLGGSLQSADEISTGAVWYFRGQHAKLTVDATHLNGAPINSPTLDISPGDDGWLFRTQVQFGF